MVLGLDISWTMEHLIGEYLMHLREMHHWRKVLPGRVVDVQYERLVLFPEQVSRCDVFAVHMMYRNMVV